LQLAVLRAVGGQSVGWLLDLLVSFSGTAGVAPRGSIAVVSVRFGTVGAVAAWITAMVTFGPLVAGSVSVGLQYSRRCVG
jgi:hypothetical protein